MWRKRDRVNPHDVPADEDVDLDAYLRTADAQMLAAIKKSFDLDVGLAQVIGGLAGNAPHTPTAEPAPRRAEVPWFSRKVVLAALAVAMVLAGTGADIAAHCCGYPSREVTASYQTAAPDQAADPSASSTWIEDIWLNAILSQETGVRRTSLHYLSLNDETGQITIASSTKVITFTEDQMATPESKTVTFTLPSRAGVFVRLDTGRGGGARIGGNPTIRYLTGSPSGPILLLAGYQSGTAVGTFSDRDGTTSLLGCLDVKRWNFPSPSVGHRLLPGDATCLTMATGRALLITAHEQTVSQIKVKITWPE